ELFRQDGDKRLCERVSVRIKVIGKQPAAESVRAGNACLESRPLRSEPLQSLEFVDDSEAAWRGDCAGHFMFAALIVSWRTEAAWRGAFQFDALQIAVK